MTLRIGLIGCGGISGAHVRGWNTITERAKVAAVADVVPANAELRSQQVGGAQIFSDYRELLKLPDIDAVDICLPHHLHKDAIVAAAQAGKHIMCEKPLCLTLDEAAVIDQAVKKAGVTMMCAHNQLFWPSLQAAKQLLDDGFLGQVYNLRTIDCFRGFLSRTATGKEEDKHPGRRADQAVMGGGELIDTGYHPTYMLLYLAGSEPVAVTAMFAKHRVKALQGEDTSHVLVQFKNGAIGSIMTSWAFEFPEGNSIFQVLGERGQIRGTEKGIFYKLNNWPTPASREFPQTDTFAAEIGHYVHCLETGDRPINTHVEGTAVLHLITSAYEAAAENVIVRVQ